MLWIRVRIVGIGGLGVGGSGRGYFPVEVEAKDCEEGIEAEEEEEECVAVLYEKPDQVR